MTEMTIPNPRNLYEWWARTFALLARRQSELLEAQLQSGFQILESVSRACRGGVQEARPSTELSKPAAARSGEEPAEARIMPMTQ